MSAYAYTNAINWVHATLVAAVAGAPFTSYTTPPLAANVLFGEDAGKSLKDRAPGIIVRLPDNWLNEDFVAVGNASRRGDIIVRVEPYIRPEDPTAPYGSSTKKGIVVFVEDVLNAIENATSGLRAGGNALALNATSRLLAVDGENLYRCELDLRITSSFFGAGAR